MPPAAKTNHPAVAAARLGGAEAEVEKPGVMRPELADKGVVEPHLGGVVGRHDDRLARCQDQDIEIVGVEHDAFPAMRIDRLPEIALRAGIANLLG
jgi:hypothetical protein